MHPNIYIYIYTYTPQRYYISYLDIHWLKWPILHIDTYTYVLNLKPKEKRKKTKNNTIGGIKLLDNLLKLQLLEKTNWETVIKVLQSRCDICHMRSIEKGNILNKKKWK